MTRLFEAANHKSAIVQPQANASMQPYPNHSGRSGVRAYEAGSDFIEVEFRNGSRYRYTHQIPGRSHVETMKQLAAEGRFLATYINTHVRQRYAVRLR